MVVATRTCAGVVSICTHLRHMPFLNALQEFCDLNFGWFEILPSKNTTVCCVRARSSSTQHVQTKTKTGQQHNTESNNADSKATAVQSWLVVCCLPCVFRWLQLPCHGTPMAPGQIAMIERDWTFAVLIIAQNKNKQDVIEKSK